MTPASIRPATPRDIDAMLRLQNASKTAAQWSRGQYEAVFLPEAPSRLALVIESAEGSGFVVAQTAGPEWELENLAIAPQARRQRLATRLVEALLQQARGAGAEAVVLEVRASNAPARGLYQSCGFEEVGRRLRYYRDPSEDAILYRYNLQKSCK